MKALSLWQPWASAMAAGGKLIETRSWSTKHRGLVAIHAAQHKDEDHLWDCRRLTAWFAALNLTEPVGELWEVLPFGAVVAVGELAGVLPVESLNHEALWVPRTRPHLGPESWWSEAGMGDYTAGRYGWVFSRVVALKEPIPFKGAQGLFTVPDELIRGMLP